MDNDRVALKTSFVNKRLDVYERTKKRKNNEGTSERKNERMSKRTNQGTNKRMKLL